MQRASMKRGALGPRAVERTPDEWFEVARATMSMPGWRIAMWSHLNLAMRVGRARPENHFSRDELHRITTPVLFIWGDDDVYGGPDIGRRSCAEMPDARLETMTEYSRQKVTLRSAWTRTTVHIHEHLGQLIAYARTNKIVPPWSK